MRALVTGASGYIGHHVCRELFARGWQVHALTRSGSDLRGLPAIRHEVDGSPASLVAAVGDSSPNVVLHLASFVKARAGPDDIAPMVQANITLGTSLLSAMAYRGCNRFVNASTYWIYDQAGRVNPNTLYAATKRAFEEVVSYHAKREGLAAISLVLFDVYGANDWRGKLLPALVRAMREGRTLDLSPGEQRLDMVEVRDVANGFAAAAEQVVSIAPGHSVYGLDSGRRVRLRDIIELTAKLAEKPVPARFAAAYEPFQIMEPVSNIPRLPGWTAAIPLEDGLRGVAAQE